MPTGQSTIRWPGRFVLRGAVLATVALAGIPAAFAQDSSVIVTGQNFRTPEYAVGKAFPTAPDAPKANLAARQEVMLWIERGNVAVVVQGPAVFKIVATDQVILNLESGRLLITAGTVEGDQPFHVTAGDPDAPDFDLPAPVGTTVIVRTGSDVDIGRLDGEGGPVTFTLLEEEVKLNIDEHIAVRNKTASRDKASAWMNDGDVAKTATNSLGFGAAKSWRGKVCDSLFSSLAYWDKTGQTNPVALLPVKVEIFDPELRTISAQISVPPASNQSSQGRPGIINFVGANEVPVASPAAIAVGGFGAAQANNAEARSLLSLTGSRGLGFGGLSLLGIRGTTAGIRATGPAGLGGP